MCGITGIFTFSESGANCKSFINDSVTALNKRGPDAQHVLIGENCALGHARLSIIDISNAADQPFKDDSGRYILIFNGEIYNYKQLYKSYLSDIELKTNSDTEVLLHLLIRKGADALNLLHGFFAFSFTDLQTQKSLIARDRLGKKPILYYRDSDKFIFASEIKAIEAFKLKLSINKNSVYQYFTYNYNPSNKETIYSEIYKLAPGEFLDVDLKTGQYQSHFWYSILPPKPNVAITYVQAQEQLINLLTDAVQERLVADVPLGAFLSGGIDSSVVVALASKFVNQLNTFSIGFSDNPFFDETKYAQLVAKKYKTNHETILIDSSVLLANVQNVLDYIDEPFADSSALAVYVLSKETKKHVTVALSGDGADEVFAGYNKYSGEYKIQNANWSLNLLKHLEPIFKQLPSSRAGTITNKVRQINKLIEGLNLESHQRFLRYCAINTSDTLQNLFSQNFKSQLVLTEIENLNTDLAKIESQISSINDILWRDQQMVLPNDMLVKVDLMSMANSLEVRSPFLDYRVVEFANKLPENFKIDSKFKKKIVQDAFKDSLPNELYNRPKKGFDVPLLSWFKNELNSFIFDDLLSKEFIQKQDIFNYEFIKTLKQKLQSNNPGDVQAQLWALIVFQFWYKKRFD